MTISAANSNLKQIPLSKIIPNPDNPRIVFRPNELEDLLESIRVYNIQVPISVFRDGDHFVLIDGERRWRCAAKLNLETVPALIQKRPSALENLLMMFNIHALREQWDLLTIALKLPRIIALLSEELGRKPTDAQLASKTGLNRAIITRSKLLMALPDKYKELILRELGKRKSDQKFTEDLFIEMERALTTVERAMPSVIPDRDVVRGVLLKKFRDGVIGNRVQFRLVGRIARAGNVGFDIPAAAEQLKKLFQPNNYSIEAAYSNSVGEAYLERDVGTRIDGLLKVLDELEPEDLEPEVREKLDALHRRLTAFVRELS